MQEYIKDHKFHLERERRYVLDCYLLSSLLPSSSHTVTSKVTKKSKEMSRTGYKPVPQVPGDKVDSSLTAMTSHSDSSY